jgi:hypothetical protein
MNKIKLTISIRPDVALEAKEWAKRNHTSISSAFELFLNEKVKNEGSVPSFAKQLLGIAKGKLSDLTDSELKELWMNDQLKK